MTSSVLEFVAATDLPVFRPAGTDWRASVSKAGVPWIELAWQRESAGGEIRIGAVRQEATFAFRHPRSQLRAIIDIEDTLEGEFSLALADGPRDPPFSDWRDAQLKLDGREVACRALIDPTDENRWIAYVPHENAWIYARSADLPWSSVELIKA